MPEMDNGRRAAGGWTAVGMPGLPLDEWSDVERLQLRTLPGPDQSRYGTATTDPLGRDGPGWHKGKNGLPVKDKQPKGDRA